MAPNREIKIAYRLREVLEHTKRCPMSTGRRISGFSLLFRLIKLTLMILFLIEVGVTCAICSISMPMVNRKPPTQLSANKVRTTDLVQVTRIEDGE